ncbi:hypothetical protein KC343_g934 [Hortaea werneckii]|uniref:RING-type domain-containing protein n=1 Tax=Hortaea werneckii TaxID=91943 RepID=A0A3M7G6P5_HORWE|nr:hypothetical protein KC352_g6518 [Hortaea werneckii]KAI7572895.1 hypothetical protein KC317_g364 [Hortaea werneckii]KAI7627714.1 hypothetical protein KC346_g603 [Hortaea werneckii]KAI7637000.1 hypothetical protein KC343_g934 [Hortaea werneckii]KAI7682775.1 hypothetical protein KC319_g825 [Hortaea werneckii]
MADSHMPRDVYTGMWENYDHHENDGNAWDFGNLSNDDLDTAEQVDRLEQEQTPPHRHSYAREAEHPAPAQPPLPPPRSPSPPTAQPSLTSTEESAPRTDLSQRAEHSENWRQDPGRGGPGSLNYILDNDFETLHTPEHSPAPDTENMPASTRRRANQGNSIVDLTAPSSPILPSSGSSAPRSLKRTAEDAQEEGRSKRRKSATKSNPIDELDLTNEAPSAEDELRQGQQASAVAAQQQADTDASASLKIGRRQCIICMEPYTNATVTACGHLYCHECLSQALIAGERNSERGIGNCPVCRKPLSRKKATQVIPLNFLKKSAFRTKGRRDMNVSG